MAASRVAPCSGLVVPDGVLVVDKPEGPSSHDVVARVRRALGVRQIGHTGTLDPLATGVLALVVGRATRLAQFLSSREKVYRARLRLGVTTDSWDRTGAVVGQAPPDLPLPDGDAVARHLEEFLGEHQQTPPPFSAKKIAGVRAYDLARRGREVTMTPVLVTLHAAAVEAVDGQFVDLRLSCSAGYYVRALAHELGRRLGCGACLEALRREASGYLTIDLAVPLQEVEEAPEAAVRRIEPLDRALPNLPSAVLTEAGLRRALHGNEVTPEHLVPGAGRSDAPAVRLLDDTGSLVAIARPTGRLGVLHPAVVLK